MEVFIHENSLIARIAAWKMSAASLAIVIGNTIHLHNTSRAAFLRNERWLCHELVHIQQFARYGAMGFIIRYLLESLRHGYRNNRYEREARQRENDSQLLLDVVIH